MTQLHDKGLVSDEQLRIMQDEVNGGGWEIQASREQQSKQPIVQTKIEVPKTEDKYVNKIGKTKLDNFLNSMHNKYNNIYQEMSDAEMDQLDYLESETYKP